MAKTLFILMSTRTNSVLCEDDEFRHISMIGPNQWSPKTFKTEGGARRAISRLGRHDLITVIA